MPRRSATSCSRFWKTWRTSSTGTRTCCGARTEPCCTSGTASLDTGQRPSYQGWRLGLLRRVGQFGDRGGGPEVLVATQVADGLDVECLLEQFRVALADTSQRRDGRVDEFGQAPSLVRLGEQ